MNKIDLKKFIELKQKELNEIASSRPMTSDLICQYEVVRRQLVSHERELCLAKNLPVILPLDDWVLRWTQYHDKVQLTSSTKTEAILACETYELRPDLLITTHVTFKGCVASKLIMFNYDNIEKHPMFHSGLEGLGAYRVENSAWKSEVLGISGLTHRHYLFCFSSCIVDVIAEYATIDQGEPRRGS